MKAILVFALLLVVALATTSCSVYRASHQPSQKNTGVMNAGAQSPTT